MLALVRGSSNLGADAHAAVRSPIDGFLPLQTQIVLALERAGIPHEVDVGASGFRVPIAITDPKDPSRFMVGLLLDDGTEDISVFERYAHRPSVLHDRGWQVLPVTAAAWHRRSEEILQAIEALAPGAHGATRTQLYRDHVAALRAPAKPESQSPSERPHGRPRRKSQPLMAAVVPESAPARLPEWATAIDDPFCRKALLHLDAHGSIDETELINLLGSARRARSFTEVIAKWSLPFTVEVSTGGAPKVYRARR